VHLPLSYVEALDALPETPIAQLILQAGRFKKSGADMRLFNRESYAAELRRYLRLLLRAVEEHDALSERPVGLPVEWWSPTALPPFGSGL